MNRNDVKRRIDPLIVSLSIVKIRYTFKEILKTKLKKTELKLNHCEMKGVGVDEQAAQDLGRSNTINIDIDDDE